MTDNGFIDSINHKYFEGKLSKSQITRLQDFDPKNTEAKNFMEGAMARIQRMGVSAKDIGELIFWEMASIWPKILPGAWSGIVPPITFPNRHVLLDDYMKKNQWKPLTEGSKVVDLGCGFPPLTALDLARKFSRVQITGADPSFGKYTVTDSKGNYACILEDGHINYLQPVAGSQESWNFIFENLDDTKKRFAIKFNELKKNLPQTEDANTYEEFQMDGWTITRNPLRRYELKNLGFIQKGMGDEEIPSHLDMIRCMNVLVYFDPVFRRDGLEWACRHLKEGGIFFCGLNWSESINSRFSVYRRENNAMQLKEFSFSIENLRPLEGVPYFSFRNDDFEQEQLLQHAVMIRQNKVFMDEFNTGFDKILHEHSVCERDSAGYLGFVNTGLPPVQLLANMSKTFKQLSDNYADGVVAVLRERGKKAWVNEIGFIGIEI
jgi:SAM-dependent methyltransferase